MAEARFCQEFGGTFKEYRQRTNQTLREFCREHSFDHGNLSRIERGRAKPPTGKALDKYLAALGISRESNEWYTFHDMAAACAGEVPEAIMSDEEVVKKLPVVFRTLARKKPTRDELDELVKIIRES